jgi:hypothetical protein
LPHSDFFPLLADANIAIVYLGAQQVPSTGITVPLFALSTVLAFEAGIIDEAAVALGAIF